MHNDDTPPTEAVNVVRYNPPMTGAYYFTDHGNKIRTSRKFTIDKKPSQNVHDDFPKVRQTDMPLFRPRIINFEQVNIGDKYTAVI